MAPDAPSYVKRPADEELYDALSNGEYCYILDSRQVGKSSLKARTAAKLRADNCAAIDIDLTRIGTLVTEEQWYWSLASEIARPLDLDQEAEACWLGSRLHGPQMRWLEILRRVILPALATRVAVPARRGAIQGTGNIVIFVDEIDLTRRLPFSTDAFFAGIRACFNDRSVDQSMQCLTFCLVGSATPASLIRDSQYTPFNIGRAIVLTDFTVTEARPLAGGFIGGRDADLLLSRVLYWTNGHPYLTQRLCAEIAADAAVTSEVTVDDKVAALFFSDASLASDSNLEFVAERLLNEEFEARNVVLTLYGRALAGLLFDDPTSAAHSQLRLSGVVRSEDGKLTVRNLVYARIFGFRWILNQIPESGFELQSTLEERIGLLLSQSEMRSNRIRTISDVQAKREIRELEELSIGLQQFGYAIGNLDNDLLARSQNSRRQLDETIAKLRKARKEASSSEEVNSRPSERIGRPAYGRLTNPFSLSYARRARLPAMEITEGLGDPKSRHNRLATLPIPDPSTNAQAASTFEPLTRLRIASAAKWNILLTYIFFLVSGPHLFSAYFYRPNRFSLEASVRSLLIAIASACAAVLLTEGVITSVGAGRGSHSERKSFPKIFRIPDAFREWIVASSLTGVFYLTVIMWLNSSGFPAPSGSLTSLSISELYPNEWQKYRFLSLCLCTLCGILIARKHSRDHENRMRSASHLSSFVTFVRAIWVALAQAVAVACLSRPIEYFLFRERGWQVVVWYAAILCALASLVIGLIAYIDDRQLKHIRPPSTNPDGSASLNIVVVGPRASGKTCLLAAAVYESEERSTYRLAFTPFKDTSGVNSVGDNKGRTQDNTWARFSDDDVQADNDFEYITHSLYSQFQFPTGNIRSMPLNIAVSYLQQPFLQLNILDMPGGAMYGRAAEERGFYRLWERIERADALVIVIDMARHVGSFRPKDFYEYSNAYRQIMSRVISHNGVKRVVPIAFVMTKCDEWVHQETGLVEERQMEHAFNERGYAELIEYWIQLCKKFNAVPVVSSWTTSAITFSIQEIPEGGHYSPKPPPPGIRPSGCIDPFLWLASTAVRWNSTLFDDLSSFCWVTRRQFRDSAEVFDELGYLTASDFSSR